MTGFSMFWIFAQLQADESATGALSANHQFACNFIDRVFSFTLNRAVLKGDV